MQGRMLAEKFFKYGRPIALKKDELIYNPNDLYGRSCAYFLDSGIAALSGTTREGEDKVYLYFREKSLVGFTQIMIKEASLEDEVREDSVEFFIVAKTDCIVYRIPEGDFHRLLKEDMEFNQCILRVLTKNYIEVLNRFHEAQEDNTTIRFCRWLLDCAVEKEGKKVIPRAFTFVEVAKYLGTHSVTVSRIASDLKRKGCIAKEDHYIVIKDEERIREVIRKEQAG